MKYRFCESYVLSPDGKYLFFPIQDENFKTMVYKFEVQQFELFSDDITFLEPNIYAQNCLTILEDTTVFGSAVHDNSLFLACFNKNRIIEISIRTGIVIRRYNVPSPNDVCVDQNFIYVAGGTNILGVNYPTLGKIYRIDRFTGKMGVFMSGFTTLSGIRKHKNKLIVSRLYDIISIDVISKEITVLSNCVENGINYLSDNITIVDNKIYVSLYRIMNDDEMLKLKVIPSVGYFLGTIFTQFVNGLRGKKINLSNPEQLLSFSKTDKMESISYMVINPDGSSNFKHVSKLKQFNGHVTQICELDENFILAANFEFPGLALIRKYLIV